MSSSSSWEDPGKLENPCQVRHGVRVPFLVLPSPGPYRRISPASGTGWVKGGGPRFIYPCGSDTPGWVRNSVTQSVCGGWRSNICNRFPTLLLRRDFTLRTADLFNPSSSRASWRQAQGTTAMNNADGTPALSLGEIHPAPSRGGKGSTF